MLKSSMYMKSGVRFRNLSCSSFTPYCRLQAHKTTNSDNNNVETLRRHHTVRNKAKQELAGAHM